MDNKFESYIRKNILDLKAYASARSTYDAGEGIFLDANESPHGVYNRYPDPNQRLLKQAISNLKNIPTNQIFIGNGSDEVIDLVFRIFCEPRKDKVMIFNPTYGMYEVLAHLNAVRVVDVPLDEDFQIDIACVIPRLADIDLKVIFICSPNNPTANLMEISSITTILQNFKGIVFIDEAYIDFSDQESFISLIQEYPNLIVSQTLSKAWGSAGIRVGIAYMHEYFAAVFNKVKPPYNVSIPNQRAALVAVSQVDTYQKQVATLHQEKEKLIVQLLALPGVKKIYPSNTNFILVEVVDANFWYRYLLDHKIIVRNRHSVIKNCLRITIGSFEENQTLVDTLKNIKDE